MQPSENPVWYVRDRNVSAKRFGEQGALLYHPDTGIEKAVNETGLFLWQHLDGSRTSRDLATELLEEFEGGSREQVCEDTGVFLENLFCEGFAHVKDSARPTGSLDEVPDVQDAPKSVDISITGKCNQHCAYCFYHDEMTSRPDLPKDEWLTFFEELGRLSVREVCLSGGEVFVRPDLWELIDGLIENRMRYSINTNGTLITENVLAEFDKGKRKTRLGSIQVSIDGSCAEVHDKSRGEGTFEKATRGLRLLKEAGFPVTVRVTVNRYNVDDLEDTAFLLLEDIGIAGFGTNDAMPMGAGRSNQASVTLTPRQQLQAMKSLAELEKKYEGRVMASAGPLAKWHMYREMEHAKRTGELSSRWQMGYLTACGCVFSKLAVNHDGTITPCNMLSKCELGRIGIDSLKHTWLNHDILKKLKERRSTPMSSLAECSDCEWAPYCNGSCPGLAYELTGDFMKANPQDCYRRFLEETAGLEGVDLSSALGDCIERD